MDFRSFRPGWLVKLEWSANIGSRYRSLQFVRAKADIDGRVGHFFLAIDPRRFRAEDSFEGDLDTLMDSLRATKPIDPHQPVQVAGDPEYAERERRSQNGIPLSRSIVEDIRTVCRESHVPFLLDLPPRGQSAP
jgi:LDH2 family malate/lactate/ureidoglycolate dehydrogenase